MAKIKKVVLAYSGGLDTSVIVKWLQQQYQCEVITFTADLGQAEEIEPARATAQKLGVEKIYIENLQEEFAREYVFPMLRCNALYEGQYMLGTAVARPLIAKRLVEIARECGADAISHGATGKGNDQIRFELSAYALSPDIKIIAPWREWDLNSRQKLMEFCQQHGIEIRNTNNDQKPPYSIDANLLHVSYEGGALEDPTNSSHILDWILTTNLESAPDCPEAISLDFQAGDAVAINGKEMTPAEILHKLNGIGGKHGVGRVDIVENRFIGMKSRGCYETPGGTILLHAHRILEAITLSRDLAHLKDELMPRYAEIIYNGLWFSPQRMALQKLIDYSQQNVNGRVELQVYKGNIVPLSRSSEDSLYHSKIASFEEDAGSYDQKDAAGFIKLNALPLRLAAKLGRKL